MTNLTSEDAARLISEQAQGAGFDVCGFAPATANDKISKGLREYLARGHHGTMAWMAETAERRSAPTHLWENARSAILLGLNYGPEHDPLAILQQKNQAAISVYAQNRDYHDLIKKKLKRIGRWMVETFGCEIKVFVDTAPLMEKPLARAAGIGWQGKHTNLVSPDFGSWLFLGAILTDLALKTDTPHGDQCGSCRACLDICPTSAFPAPYQIDARRCISYLTIEHKGHIPREFRKAMGNRIYGCDDCLAVCPWNKFAKTSQEAAFFARAELKSPELGDLAELDDATFRQVFSGSPIKRIGRDRFVRNVLIAIGNSGDKNHAPAVTEKLSDPSPLVRAMAVWALGALLGSEAKNMKTDRTDDDPDIAAEWETIEDHPRQSYPD